MLYYYFASVKFDEPKSRPKPAFHNKHTLYDPSINNVVVSCSTLKYALVAASALGLLASFIYLLVIGVLNQQTCLDTAEASLATYLIVMGCVGCARLLTFFACPFDYSKSILSRMYEHLVWRLVVNRFKTAYHGAAARLKTRVWEQDESASISRRAYFRLACVGGFMYQFVCCSGFQCSSIVASNTWLSSFICCCVSRRSTEDEHDGGEADDYDQNYIECSRQTNIPTIPEVSTKIVIRLKLLKST